MRQRPSRDPLRRLLSLRGCPFGPALNSHPRPRDRIPAFQGRGVQVKTAFDLIQRDAFKSAVGRAMFCGHPDCGVILDYRRAVELSACKGPHYVSVKVFCADCADRVRPVIESKLGPLGLRLEVVDGRQFR